MIIEKHTHRRMERGQQEQSCFYKARYLVGPTASGKTAVAHELASRHGWVLFSADAMLVYRGMDIGTAKPTAKEREQYLYGGLDLLDPWENADLHHYLETARSFFERAAADDTEVLVVGGSGLYIKALINGLDPAPGKDKSWRAEAETVLAEDGVAGLQSLVRGRDPQVFAKIDDPANPRRLVRALERSTGSAERSWEQRANTPLAGIHVPRDLLHDRIAARASKMMADGLLEETRGLLANGPLSLTAAQAIGYREAIAVLEGGMTPSEAVERVIVRTRQLAKRQMTWFRRQVQVEWIDVDKAATPGQLADAAEKVWKKHGRTTVHF